MATLNGYNPYLVVAVENVLIQNKGREGNRTGRRRRRRRKEKDSEEDLVCVSQLCHILARIGEAGVYKMYREVTCGAGK